MNKNICLLVAVALVLAQAAATTEVEKGDHHLGQAIGDYINNWMYFGMLTVYNLYCFCIGITYTFWFNDMGHHFYKCYQSVPKRVVFL